MPLQEVILRSRADGSVDRGLDRENGKWLYANRLQAILMSRRDRPRLRKRLRKCLHYVEFPSLNRNDGAALADWALALNVDLVVFDSQRMFLTDLGLAEDRADDYAMYMSATVAPLFEVGIATLILDNTGHGKDPRSRGTSAKRDLNELLFTLRVDRPFSESNRGRLRLHLGAGDSRLGNEGDWEMAIGGGEFDSWRKVKPSVETPSQPKAGTDRAEDLLLAYLIVLR